MALSKPYNNIEYSADVWSEYENAQSFWDFDIQNYITKTANTITILEGAKLFIAGKWIIIDSNVVLNFPITSDLGYFNIYAKIDAANKTLTFEVGTLNEFKLAGSLQTIYYANFARYYHTGGSLDLANNRVVGLTENATRNYTSCEQLFNDGSINKLTTDILTKLNILDTLEMIIPNENIDLFNKIQAFTYLRNTGQYLVKIKRLSPTISTLDITDIEYPSNMFSLRLNEDGSLGYNSGQPMIDLGSLEVTYPADVRLLLRLTHGQTYLNRTLNSNLSNIPPEVTGVSTIYAIKIGTRVKIEITSDTDLTYHAIIDDLTSPINWKGTAQGQIFNGTTVPLNSLGKDDDIYVRY